MRSNISIRQWCENNDCINLLGYLVNPLDADNYSYASHTKLAWRCNLGHICYSEPYKFTTRGSASRDLGVYSCQVCQGKQILVGFNDLATTRPDLADEWDYNKNDITPRDITAGSYKDAWWRCKYRHSWKARISARDYGNGCPYCSGRSRTSIPEQIIYFYIKKYFPDSLNMETINGISYDIYIPSRKVVIEYDGSYWHRINNTDYKFKEAMKSELILYKITGVSEGRGLNNVFYYNDDCLNLTFVNNNLVSVLRLFLKKVFNIDEMFYDYMDAYNFACYQKLKSRESVIELPDGITFEWSPLNNYDYTYISNDNIPKFWRCFKGHTFKRRLDVIKRGHVDCPYCENRASFEFFYLGKFNGLRLILDMKSMELELLNDSSIISAMDLGINIRGVQLDGAMLVFSIDYILRMKATTFRNIFECYIGKVFKSCSDCDYLAKDLTEVFSYGYSAEEIHKRLNKFLTKS